MTFLVNPPRPVEVETDQDGAPRHIRADPLTGPVEPVQCWIVDVDWWSRPVSREYWQVVLHDRLLCEIYHDLDEDRWFIERVYD